MSTQSRNSKAQVRSQRRHRGRFYQPFADTFFSRMLSLCLTTMPQSFALATDYESLEGSCRQHAVVLQCPHWLSSLGTRRCPRANACFRAFPPGAWSRRWFSCTTWENRSVYLRNLFGRFEAHSPPFPFTPSERISARPQGYTFHSSRVVSPGIL